MKSAQNCGRIIFIAGEGDVMRTRHHDCIADRHGRRICMDRGKLIYPGRSAELCSLCSLNKHAAIRGVLLC